MEKTRSFKRITYSDRLKIEALYNADVSIKEISEQLGFHFTSIYREVKNGFYDRKNSDWTYTKCYSADIAERKYKFNTAARAKDLKIGNNYDFIRKMEYQLLYEKDSPSAALKKLKKENPNFPDISFRTVYRYIDNGIFPNVRRSDLPFKGKRQKKKKKTVQKAARFGKSIELRPMEILMREGFGNWELDSVIGRREKGNTMLVLTERKTNFELVFRSKDKTVFSTVKMLDRLEKKLGKDFSKIFKTITCDNGCEFASSDLLERSVRKRGKRTEVYYCHPYSSWERGSNEKQNQMLRRHIKKGTRIENYSDADLKRAEIWLNTYPRKKYDWQTSAELFKKELENIGIKNFSNFF